MNVPSPSRAARGLAALTAACAVATATAPGAFALNADKYFYPNGSGVSTNTSLSQWFHLYLNDSADVSSSGAECVVTFNNGHAFGHKISGTTIKSSDKHLSLQNTFRWNTVTGSVSIGKGGIGGTVGLSANQLTDTINAGSTTPGSVDLNYGGVKGTGILTSVSRGETGTWQVAGNYNTYHVGDSKSILIC